MFLIKAGEKRIRIPSSWKDVTVKQYADIVRMLDKYGGENLTDIEGLESMTSILLILCNDLDSDLIDQMEAHVILQMFEVLRRFLEDKPEDRHITEFSHNGLTWKMPKKYMESSTFGEFMDAMLFESKVDEFTNRFDVLPDIIAVLCKQKDEVIYNSDLVAQRRKIFETLDMDTAFQITFFLTNHLSLLSKDSVTSSQHPSEKGSRQTMQ